MVSTVENPIPDEFESLLGKQLGLELATLLTKQVTLDRPN